VALAGPGDFQTQAKQQAKERVMNVDKAVLMFAGFVVLLGLALGYMISPYWYLLTAFAGLNMFQASITGFCPAAIVFRKFGLRSGNAFS
jgi:Protein of unknown function (DUF2892)